MKFQAVVFDLFGTLVDDFVSSTKQANVDLATALDVPQEPFTQKWRQTSAMRIDGTFQTIEASIQYVCNAIGTKVTKERMNKAVESRLQQIRQALKPKPDAIATLTRLKDDGYKIGLLSNCSIEIPIVWEETPFAGLIHSAVFSSRERLKKPDARIFRLACERLGAMPEECVYVADGENHELTAATDVGLHAVLIQNPTAQRRPKLFSEAEEWRGDIVSALVEVLSVMDLNRV